MVARDRIGTGTKGRHLQITLHTALPRSLQHAGGGLYMQPLEGDPSGRKLPDDPHQIDHPVTPLDRRQVTGRVGYVTLHVADPGMFCGRRSMGQ